MENDIKKHYFVFCDVTMMLLRSQSIQNNGCKK